MATNRQQRHQHKYRMNWTRLKRTAAPTAPVLDVSDIKTHLNIAHSDEDTLLAVLIDVATDCIDGPNGIGLALATQSWRMTLDYLPATVELALHPVQSVQSVTIDGQTLDPASYRLCADQRPALLVVDRPVTTVKTGSVQINFTAGYGDDVPADLKHVIRMLVGHYYRFREATSESQVREIPLAVATILQRY